LTAVEKYDKKSYDKKSGPSIFDLWMLELKNPDLNIGFLIHNCIYIYREREREPAGIKKNPDSITKQCNFLSYGALRQLMNNLINQSANASTLTGI